MASTALSIRNQSAYVPALIVVGLFFGMTIGALLSYLPFAGSDSHQQSVPQFLNTASQSLPTVPARSNTSEAIATRATSAKSAARAGLATNKDAATTGVTRITQYLHSLKNLPHDSKTMLGLFNADRIHQFSWNWSEADLPATLDKNHDLFGSTVIAATAPQLKTTSNSTDLTSIDTAHVNEKQRLVVALDPGHGGIDPGSQAHNGLIEKELTLDMAKRIALFLSEIENVDVIMTRSNDTGMSRQARVNKIKASGADLVVSLHFNHLPQPKVNLVETFFADRHNVVESLEAQKLPTSSIDLDYTKASRDLADILHEKVYNEVASVNDAVIDAGVKRDTLFVLTRSFTPGVLLELTCISNPAEAARLTTFEYRNQLAAAIADGLRDYLLREHAEQFSELLAKVDS